MEQSNLQNQNSVRMTYAEWRAEGIRRFGENTDKWRFVCPSCGNVASIGDFKPYAGAGAQPNSATCECIGRYTGATDAFLGEKCRPCNYAGYGLFRMSPVIVQHEGEEIHSFAFAEVEAA